jgi:hypothetical protein
MNRNILRLGIYELLFGAEYGTPKKLLSTKPSKWPKLLEEKLWKVCKWCFGEYFKDLENKEESK